MFNSWGSIDGQCGLVVVVVQSLAGCMPRYHSVVTRHAAQAVLHCAPILIQVGSQDLALEALEGDPVLIAREMEVPCCLYLT